MSTRAFVETVRKSAGRRPLECPPLFVEWLPGVGTERPWVWTFPDVTIYPNVGRRLSESVYVAIVYPDGSAQLLSRDEDGCMLFTTLWELGR